MNHRNSLLSLALLFSGLAFASDGPDPQSPQEVEAARQTILRDFQGSIDISHLSAFSRSIVMANYSYLDPDQLVPKDLLATALVYFDANQMRFSNRRYISIVDFTPRSDAHRFFLVDLQTGEVEQYHTTHGIGSDRNRDGFAESFGNVIDSGKSSLGFIRTGEIYWGKFKRSVRLDGLSSTNSNIRRRAIVFHGWDNVHEENVIQGLSWGCITIDWNFKDALLDKIAEGSLMFIGTSS